MRHNIELTETRMPGRLIGIASRTAKRAPMQLLAAAELSLAAGLIGCWRSAKFKSRQITIMAREDWQAALLDLVGPVGPPDLAWTTRRANLLVEGVRLPRAKGGVLRVGATVLEITGQTNPCHRMEEAYRGLLSALHPQWRGGVTCRIVEAGSIRLGDAVEILVAPVEHVIRLPG